MKRVLFGIILFSLLICAFSLNAYAKEAYIEEIPSNLKAENEAPVYFVVFEGEEYYVGGSTINGLNVETISAELSRLGISNVGGNTQYLIKYVFPSTMGESTVTTVDFNGGIKRSEYFKSFCGAYVLPSTVVNITDMNDCTAQLRSIDFGENNKIAVIPYCFASRSGNLREIKNFPKNLDIIEEQAFSGCGDAFSGELYINATSIKRKAFDNAIGIKVTGIVFGPKVNNIATEAFSTRELNKGSSGVKYIEFQGDITQITGIVNSAENQGAFYFKSGSQRNAYSSLVCIILSNPAQANCQGKTLQDYLPNVFFNSQSSNGGNPVMPKHNYGEYEVFYESYFKPGTMTSVCLDCENKMLGERLDPLFVDLGYSYSLVGDPSITYSIFVNYGAVSFFNARIKDNQKIREYGLLVANKELVGDSTFNEDMTEKTGAIHINFNMFGSNAYIDIKVINLVGEKNGVSYDYTDRELVLTAYCIVDGKALYLDDGEMKSTLGQGITYNSVK